MVSDVIARLVHVITRGDLSRQPLNQRGRRGRLRRG